MTRELPGRLPVERMYPAGLADHTSRMVLLPSGQGMHVVEAGPAEGEPVLLIHGWGCWAYVWRYQIAALARAGFRVIAPDLPGHGHSDKPLDGAEYTRAALTHSMEALMQAMGIARASVVGHSMGGAVATELALSRPDLVTELALVSPVGFGRVRFVTLGRLASPKATLALLPRLAGRWAVRLAFRIAYSARPGSTPADVDQYWAPTRHPEYAHAMRHLLHQFGWDPIDRGELTKLAMPKLIAYGTRDRFVHVSEEAVAAAVAGKAPTRVLRLAGVGHVPLEEVPEQVSEALLEFLRR